MEEQKQIREREERQRKTKERLAEAENAKRAKQMREQELKRKAEEDANANLDPRMSVILEQMATNQTPYELSMQGVDLSKNKHMPFAK